MNDDKDNGSPHDGDSSATPTGFGTQCHFDRATHSVNITGHPYGQSPLQPQQLLQQPPAPPPPQSAAQAALEHSMNGTGGPLSPSPGFGSFRDHIKTKTSFAETFMKNLSRNNNNNSSINNYNHLGNSLPESTAVTRKPDNFAILQANSKKILDTSRKPHKYLAKRKILMHYNEEMNEKRRKEMECYGNEPDANSNSEVTLVEETATAPESLGLTSVVSVSTVSNSSSNNYKIRLMEKHQNDTAAAAAAASAAAIAVATATTSKHNNNDKTNNDKESHAHKEPTRMEEEATEALNLVQNSTNISGANNGQKTAADTDMHAKESAPTVAITPLVPLINIKVEQPDLSYNMGNNTGSGLSSGASSSACSIGGRSSTSTSDEDELERERERELERALEREREHECERERERERTIERERERERDHSQYHADYNNDEIERDSNNNNSKDTANLNKNAALIQAITRNMEHPKSDNNNNHTELDLSNTHLGGLGLVTGLADNDTVKNIATAEILCGLKSKVFKMEKLDEEREREHENCRSLSEIKNAGD